MVESVLDNWRRTQTKWPTLAELMEVCEERTRRAHAAASGRFEPWREGIISDEEYQSMPLSAKAREQDLRAWSWQEKANKVVDMKQPRAGQSELWWSYIRQRDACTDEANRLRAKMRDGPLSQAKHRP